MAHRRLLAAMVLLLTGMASTMTVASPNGLGSEADQGCVCHTPDSSTTLALDGLPDVFASSETYALTLSVVSPLEPADNRSQGGFRWLVDEGELAPVNNSTVQALDGGWTHTSSGSLVRSWEVLWTAPLDNTTAANFVIYGNAVNGNNAPPGDAWGVLEVVVPGDAYEGDLNPAEGIDGVSYNDRLFLVVGLMMIAGLLWAVARS